jgi:AraC-like DNA-binding protein
LKKSLFVDGFLPNLNSSGYLQFTKDEAFYRPLHNHPESTELLLICEGEGKYNIDGKDYNIESQSLIVYNQGVWHEERSLAHKSHRMIYLDFSKLKMVEWPEGNFIGDHQFPVISLRDHYFTVEQRFREIINQVDRKSPESQRIINHLLYVLLAELTDIIHHKDKGNKALDATQSVNKIIHYIHNNYNNEITLEELSRISHVSPFHLIRQFKKKTGLSPIQYLIHYRLEVSKQFLINTDENIESISELVGYQSVTYFQNIFKKIVGIPPGEFRSLENTNVN